MSKRKKTESSSLPWKKVLLTEVDMERVSEFGGGFYGFEELDGKIYDDFVATGQLPETNEEGEGQLEGEQAEVQEPKPKKAKKTKKKTKQAKNRAKKAEVQEQEGDGEGENQGDEGGEEQEGDDGEEPLEEVVLEDAAAPADLSPEWDNLGIPPVLLTRLSQLGLLPSVI